MRALRLLMMLALAATISSAAVAEDASRATLRAACRADIEKFCSDHQPGSGGVGKCLRQHRKELSTECQEAAKAARAARQTGQTSPSR